MIKIGWSALADHPQSVDKVRGKAPDFVYTLKHDI